MKKKPRPLGIPVLFRGYAWEPTAYDAESDTYSLASLDGQGHATAHASDLRTAP